jgi:hypothetical protein
MKKVLGCLLLASALVFAADIDVTGKWSGSFEPEGGDGAGTALLVLQQKGTAITGSVGPNEENRYDIEKGTIEGDKVTLDVKNEGRTMHFALVLSGDHLKGEAQMSAEGQTRKAKIDVTKAK